MSYRYGNVKSRKGFQAGRPMLHVRPHRRQSKSILVVLVSQAYRSTTNLGSVTLQSYVDPRPLSWVAS